MLNKYRNEFSIYHQPDFFFSSSKSVQIELSQHVFFEVCQLLYFYIFKEIMFKWKNGCRILLRDDPKFPKNNLHTWPCMEWFLIIYHFLCHWTSSINMCINNLRRISSHSKVNELHTDSLTLSAALPLSLDHHHMWHSLSK